VYTRICRSHRIRYVRRDGVKRMEIAFLMKRRPSRVFRRAEYYRGERVKNNAFLVRDARTRMDGRGMAFSRPDVGITDIRYA